MKKLKPKSTAYLVGIIYYAWQMSWLRGNEVANQITNPFMAKIFAFSALTLAVLFFALAPVIFVIIYNRLKLNLSQARVIWLASAVWVLCEAARSVLFSFYSSGPGASFGNYWHFGNFGIGLINTPLVYLSRFGGLFILTFAASALLVSLAYGVKNKRIWPFVIVLGIFSTLSFVGYTLYKSPNGRELQVGAISVEPNDNEYVPSDSGLKAVRQLPANKQNIVVLPEYSRYWDFDQAKESEAMKNVLKDDGLVINSIQQNMDNKTYNAVATMSADGIVTNSQTKSFLIPGGEFVPYIYRAALRITGQSKLLNDFENRRAIAKSRTKEKPFIWQGTTIGALACSAANAPEIYRSLSSQNSEVLINSASLGTLGVGKKYHDQSLNMAKFHAIANARPFVQAARGGYIFALDINGRTVSMNKVRKNSAISANIKTNHQKTPYTILGDWPIYASLLLIVLTNRKQLLTWLTKRKSLQK